MMTELRWQNLRAWLHLRSDSELAVILWALAAEMQDRGDGDHGELRKTARALARGTDLADLVRRYLEP